MISAAWFTVGYFAGVLVMWVFARQPDIGPEPGSPEWAAQKLRRKAVAWNPFMFSYDRNELLEQARNLDRERGSTNV